MLNSYRPVKLFSNLTNYVALQVKKWQGIKGYLVQPVQETILVLKLYPVELRIPLFQDY